jgi:hypothetical protein
MKKSITIFEALFFASLMLSSCGSKMTVCECLKDDGANKKECDELGNSMSASERSAEIDKCK